MNNIAREVIIPPVGTFRTVFLYVGQGEATLMVIPSGESFIYVLIDTNQDEKNEGINLAKLLSDLLDDKLDVFINTHPHNDHLRGLSDIQNEIDISEVWHSGHKPGKKHDDAYKELEEIIKNVGGENTFVLFGTNDPNKIRESDKETEIERKLGDIDYIVLSPAEYVSEEIEEEDPEVRYNRIHEQCAVIKFTYGNEPRHILITGDADKPAWEKHITEYHKEKLRSDVLSAIHHGSRSFFKDREEDEKSYEDHIQAIQPNHLVISAPKQSESQWGHPHDDAIEIYKKYVGEDEIYHLGDKRSCVIVDISVDGDFKVVLDHDLVDCYGYKSDKKEKSGPPKRNISVLTPRIDEKPMGKNVV